MRAMATENKIFLLYKLIFKLVMHIMTGLKRKLDSSNQDNECDRSASSSCCSRALDLICMHLVYKYPSAHMVEHWLVGNKEPSTKKLY